MTTDADASEYVFLYGEGAYEELRGAEAHLPDHLTRLYGLESPACVRLDTGVWRIDSIGSPRWVARLSPPGRELEQVEADAAVLRLLETAGFAAERCAHREPVSSVQGLGLLVTRHIDGAMAAYTRPNLQRMGRMLGDLHARPCAWSQHVPREAGALHQICVNGGPPKRTLAAARGWLANVDPQMASKHAELYEAVATALAAADDCAGLPTAFVHPDFWPGNVVTNPQGELVPIDWTGAGRGPRIRSLATLLWLAVTRHPRGSRLDMAAAAAAGYREHVRLSPEEIDRLPGAMLNPVTALACLQFCSGNPRAAAKLVDPTLQDLADRITDQVRVAMGA